VKLGKMGLTLEQFANQYSDANPGDISGGGAPEDPLPPYLDNIYQIGDGNLIDGSYFVIPGGQIVYVDPHGGGPIVYSSVGSTINGIELPAQTGLTGATGPITVVAGNKSLSLSPGQSIDFTVHGFPGGISVFALMGVPGNVQHLVLGLRFAQRNVPLLAAVTLAVKGDRNNDGLANCADLEVIRRSFGAKAGQARFDYHADVNGDGVVNIVDLAAEAKLLAPGTTCK
jgi:hypothetical protein